LDGDRPEVADLGMVAGVAAGFAFSGLASLDVEFGGASVVQASLVVSGVVTTATRVLAGPPARRTHILVAERGCDKRVLVYLDDQLTRRVGPKRLAAGQQDVEEAVAGVLGYHLSSFC